MACALAVLVSLGAPAAPTKTIVQAMAAPTKTLTLTPSCQCYAFADGLKEEDLDPGALDHGLPVEVCAKPKLVNLPGDVGDPGDPYDDDRGDVVSKLVCSPLERMTVPGVAPGCGTDKFKCIGERETEEWEEDEDEDWIEEGENSTAPYSDEDMMVVEEEGEWAANWTATSAEDVVD